MKLRRRSARFTMGAIAGLLTVAAAVTGLGPASAAGRSVPDGKCVISATDRNRTVDSLQNHCTSTQILDLFARAPLGVTPVGRKPLALLPVMHARGELLPYEQAKAFTSTQNKFGSSLTFTTGPQRQPWVFKDYVFGQDIGAAIKLGTSNWDRKPAWLADFAPTS